MRAQAIGFGVVGLGAYGETYLACLRDLRGSAGIELAAVASRTAERASECADRYGVQRWYTTPEELASDPAVDVVCVVTSEDAHLRPTLAALEAGKDAIVEKPFATSLADADMMIGAARTSGRRLLVGHQLRSSGPYVEVARRLANDELGTVVSLRTRRNRPARAMAEYRRTHPLLETGIHDIDVMLWLAGSRVRKVYAITRTVVPGPTPDGVWAMLEFESGAVGALETIWLAPDSAGVYTDDALTVTGSNGSARLDLATGPLQLWTQAGASVPDLFYEPRQLDGTVAGALRDHLLYYIGCVREGRAVDRPPLHEIRHGLEVVTAMLESAEHGREVVLASA